MREFHEIRKDLSGDEAAPYIGLARTLLGQLKTRMALGGLAQLARTITLPDGTTISVASRHGQDTVRIVASLPLVQVPGVPVTQPEPDEVSPEVPVVPPIRVDTAGLVIVGWGGTDNNQAFRWTPAGVRLLGYLPGSTDSFARAVSANGVVVCGDSEGGGRPTQAFRWTQAGGMVGLGFANPLFHSSQATGVSADGTVITGTSRVSVATDKAFRWTRQTGIVPLGTLFSNGTAISASGNVIVGKAFLSGGSTSQAFRWTAATGMVLLGTLPSAFAASSSAAAVSASGNVVVGVSNSGTTQQAFRWTQAGGMVGLALPPGATFSFASGVSADGTVVVGGSDAGAWRWSAATGSVVIPGVAVANGVSADDRIVVGGDASANPGYWTQAHGFVAIPNVVLGPASAVATPELSFTV